MPKQSPSLPIGSDRGTEAGTGRYKERFQSGFDADYFRSTNTGLAVSSIGIGTYLGDSSDEDDVAYTAAVKHAIASGINLIDTSINYRSQRSELAVCRAVREAIAAGTVQRDEIVLCSKGGYIPLDRTPPASRDAYVAYVRSAFIEPRILHPDEIIGGGYSLAPRFLRYCLAKSRQNLGARTIDIYYLHNPGQLLETMTAGEARAALAAAMGVLEEAAGRGEIGVYGCATWDELRAEPGKPGRLSLADLVQVAREVGGEGHRFRVVQLPVNLAMTEAVRSQTQESDGAPVSALQAAADLGLTVVGSAALMQARLTRGLPASLHAHFPGAQTDAQRALSFARTLPGVTTALVGMKRTSHVDENLGAGRLGTAG